MKKEFSREYLQYLNSAHWMQLKLQAFQHYGKRCDHCLSHFNIQVHHIRYPEPLTSATIKDVLPLCDECHCKVHGKTYVPRPKFKRTIWPKEKRKRKKQLKALLKSVYHPKSYPSKWKDHKDSGPAYRALPDHCMKAHES